MHFTVSTSESLHLGFLRRHIRWIGDSLRFEMAFVAGRYNFITHDHVQLFNSVATLLSGRKNFFQSRVDVIFESNYVAKAKMQASNDIQGASLHIKMIE